MRKPETGKAGRIARYAWGDDYHDVMLAALARAGRSCCRRMAACKNATSIPVQFWNAITRREAGIGWHGKSTMLLDRKLGTWFFLGEILTTLDLPPDAPQVARCGTCTRCMTACPTGAITSDHRLDARRCISYLTIELKGSIPLEFRPLIGDRIYGCDTCLDVCPWNRFAADFARKRLRRPPRHERDAVARFSLVRRRRNSARSFAVRRSSASSAAASCATFAWRSGTSATRARFARRWNARRPIPSR